MKKYIISLITVISIFALASCSGAKVEIPEADEVICQSIEAGTIPGAVLAVVKGDRVVYKKAYGNKFLVPKVEPMTEDVIFDIASITKPVGTAMSLMQLVEQGKVDLKANIGTYLPDFDPDENITV
ncbi:MAG: beta-lactamase family protein, partial [Bacteroidales bacterium]|nr:beta-lactamase family protein [Bacteroidales bacterium]